MKRTISILVLAFITVSFLTAATPTTDIKLIHGLPSKMNVGDLAMVTIQVNSDQEFVSAMALPSFAYPGKGVVAVQGGDRAGSGTSAVLNVTFQAKSSTAKMADGVAPVYVVVGVRYGGGYVASQQFLFYVKVP